MEVADSGWQAVEQSELTGWSLPCEVVSKGAIARPVAKSLAKAFNWVWPCQRHSGIWSVQALRTCPNFASCGKGNDLVSPFQVSCTESGRSDYRRDGTANSDLSTEDWLMWIGLRRCSQSLEDMSLWKHLTHKQTPCYPHSL